MAIAENEPNPGAGYWPKSQATRLAEALAHPVRLNLLRVIAEGAVSPAEFASIRSEPVSAVTPHFAILENLDCIEPVPGEAAGEAAEDPERHPYRLQETIDFDDESWARVPPEARQIFAGSTVRNLSDEMAIAVEAGTAFARPDTHITWQTVELDELAWKRTAAILGRALAEVTEVRRDAARRLAASGEPPISVTIALTAFESPRRD